MRDGEDDDAVFIRAVHESETEVLDEYATRILRGGRTREWESKGARRRFFYGRSKTISRSGLLVVVVSDFGKKLAPRRRDEARALHREIRRASANTSSAGYDGI